MTKSEAQTRSELIDQQLALSGWNVQDPTQVVEEFDIRTELPPGVAEPRTPYEGHQFSDYVLLGKDRKPLAVIEAKKTSRDAAIGREQAKQYCYNIQKQLDGELPFCFYTNGHELYFWDLENAPPRKVVGFPTRDDLERFAYIRRNRKPLTQEFINTSIAGRDYQIRAIRSVLEGIEKKQRDFLLVMATGTGKTRTCIAMVDALMRAGHAEKVLFLVDRIALREQALAAFKEHMPNEPRWPNVGEKLIATDRRVYVATYPTMLNIIRDEAQHLSPHFFDFIVVDESHRSIYNTFGEVLDYFKAITLGLTATPTDIIDHNTFQLFHCDDGIPTFAYTYEEAVNNVPPYLCNFQVMKIQTKFQMEGISKRTISLEDQKKLILQGTEIEDINFEGTQLEKQVINKGTNTLIVREFMEEAIKDANGVLPGKTIFFCATKAHARRMEEIFDKLYPQYHGELAKVLVSDDPRVYGKGGLLDQFTNNDMPRIAISVDMLDTGIDVREIAKLRLQVAALPKESVVIKEAAAALARLEDDNFWISLSHERLEFLRAEIKPLFRTVSEADFKAMRFERDLLEYSLAVLNEDKEQAETIKEGIVEQISELPLSVSFVKQEETLIRAAQTSHYWAKADEDAFDELIAKLGPLMKFREQSTGQEQTHLDLADELHKKEWVEFGPQHEAVSITRYREMVETLIAALTEHNPVLQKIKNGAESRPLRTQPV